MGIGCLCRKKGRKFKIVLDLDNNAAEKLIAEAEEEARREATGTVAEVSRRAGELVAAEAETARREAAELEKSAAANTDEAVKMIFWEIVEKCQRA